MSNRFVRQIDPKVPDEVVVPKQISEHSEANNIVLVGDPGAGKSHLFDELARASRTTVQSARAFLNTPPGPAGGTLFIDALDERRAGRSDQATIDLIVQKLFNVNAQKVRLACRAQDWLGGTDLAAFHPYFAQSGGHVVLALEPLTVTEQHEVLQSAGVSNPRHFLQQAEKRGLSEFLTNPQNLIMLAEVVLKKAWPKTRRQLLEDTTVILLQEHNIARVRSGGGIFSAAEVRPAAGAACALRLISDVEGISLVEAELEPSFPSYRTIPFSTPELTLAALGRRAFRALDNEAVEYSHRVRAEYAAADWLAKQIRNGLPLSRVQALIGIDGVPAPELRGMHAWLALMLPDLSETIIDADPLGLLIHGDANSLSLNQRVRLLNALSHLAAADPFFRPEAHALTTLHPLCRADMEIHLRRILKDKAAPFGIKHLVLDALSSAQPIPGLQKDILAVIADKSVPFGLKVPAVQAAAIYGQTSNHAIGKIYRNLNASADSLRLRAYILSQFYVGGGFTAQDVAQLYKATLHFNGELITGVLWPLPTSIPVGQIPLVLDIIAADVNHRRQKNSSVNYFELERFVERLIVRALQERAEGVSGQHIWSWLEIRHSIRGNEYSERNFEGLSSLLSERPELMRTTFESAVDSLTQKTSLWRFTNGLREFLPLPLSGSPIRWLIGMLGARADDISQTPHLYELAFSWIYGNSEDNRDIFETLYSWGDTAPELQCIRERWSSSLLQTWRAEDKQRATAELERKSDGRQKKLALFAKDTSKIRTGSHTGWMIWAADVYFANFSDVDSNKSPRDRLEEELGAENAAFALEGLKAFVHKASLPSLGDLANAESNNSYPKLWHALLAGMDELWLETPSLSGLLDETLKVLVGIELLMPTMSTDNSRTMVRDSHTWKDHLVSTKPSLVKDTYLFLVEAGLRQNLQHISGFHALLNDVSLAPFRGPVTAHLLSTCSNLRPEHLEELLQVALTQCPREELLRLAKGRMADAALSAEQRQLWALAAYLLMPSEHEALLLEYSMNAPMIVWRMRALTSYDRHNRSKPAVVTTPSQRATFAMISAGHFPNTGYPNGGWSGDENPWDASEYIRSLLDSLSADSSDEALAALQRLANESVMMSYLDSIKHALANQRVKYREKKYRQPSWAEAIATLSGAAPANVADLQALVIDLLSEINTRIGGQNTDIYKSFWNEDSRGRPVDPKIEESARDVLLNLLKARLEPLNIIAEPEGHMAADKRADITAALPNQKLIIELKRDIHPELWTAPATQLDRFYTRDPEASGYGIFGVFWYGQNRKKGIPKHPKRRAAPKTAIELEAMLNEIIREEGRHKLRAIVIDVSVPDGQSIGIPSKKRGKTKKAASIRRRAKRAKQSTKLSDDSKRNRKSPTTSKVKAYSKGKSTKMIERRPKKGSDKLSQMKRNPISSKLKSKKKK